jgi:hypothetical protein
MNSVINLVLNTFTVLLPASMALTVASETQETDFCTFFMVAEGSTDISYVRNEDK